MVRFFNTLSGAVEPFMPLSPHRVGMYHCGPTVYDFVHIGNLRSYVFADVLRRTLEQEGFTVRQVINITDVGHLTSDADEGDDKIEKGAAREGVSAKEITGRYTSAFHADLLALNIKTEGTEFPIATDFINEQIELVRTLETNGFTYQTADGIYFDTSKFTGYGKLGGIDLAGLKAGARVAENVEKRNSTDFALWKLSPIDSARQQEWQSPWGVGFPGWHIECSAMSERLLGVPFDIHTGGIDHIPVHHNNEIAQTEAARGVALARYFLHNAFVNVDGRKMAKSEGTGYRLADLESRGVSPLAYRYFLLNAHYRTPVNFTWEAAAGAQNAYERLIERVMDLPDGGRANDAYVRKFSEALADDLATPVALALLWELLADNSVEPAVKRATIVRFDDVLGLKLDGRVREDVPFPIQSLVAEREEARAQKNWERADALRSQIEKKGFEILDTDEGPKVRRA